MEICATLCYAAFGILEKLTKFSINLIKVIPASSAVGNRPNLSPTRGHELTDEESRAFQLGGKTITGACTREKKM